MDSQGFNNPFDEDEKKNNPAFNDNMSPIESAGLSRRTIIWLLAGIVALGCGVAVCGAAFFLFQPNSTSLLDQYFPTPTFTPSRTPTSTSTLTPTPTNTPTPTPNLTATVQVQNAQSTAESAFNNWKVIRSDTFDTNKNNWLVEEAGEDEFATTTYKITDGKYRWDTTAHQSFIGWVRTGKKELTDFYLSVDIQKLEGPDTADYGVIFREDKDSNFYYFGITDQGEYILYMFFEEWDTLVNWTETDLIKPGEVNRLTVIGEGSHFTFFINDQYLTEITDDTIPEGSFALAIELSNADDRGVFEFDNFELRAP